VRIILTPASLSYAIRQITAAADGQHEIELRQRKRTLDQNSKLWACLQDIAEQVVWYGSKLTAEEWKDVFSAALKRSKVVPGIEGGFVVVGQHTSRMTKAEFSELLEMILAFGADKGVVWSEEGRARVSG